MLRDFVLYLMLASVFVVMELIMAIRDGYAFEWQVRRLPKVPEKFLTFWGHGGMHGDFWIINPIVAYLLAAHAASWLLPGFAFVFTAVALVGMVLLIPLLEDSKNVPSSLARDGLLPIAGAMHYLYYAVGMSVPLSYYLFTKRADVSATEVIIITVALAVHWGIGVLQPPKKVHGKIHLPAVLTAIGGWIVMAVLALWLLGIIADA